MGVLGIDSYSRGFGFDKELHGKQKVSFFNDLKEMIKEVEISQRRADQAIRQAAIEGPVSVHETMLKVEEANIKMRLLLKVRNKAVEAYHELMRMQI